MTTTKRAKAKPTLAGTMKEIATIKNDMRRLCDVVDALVTYHENRPEARKHEAHEAHKPEQPKPLLWEPEEGDTYYFVDAGGEVEEVEEVEEDNDIPLYHELHNNCFKTKRDAMEASELQHQLNLMCRAAAEVDPEWGKWSEDRNHSVYLSHGKWEGMRFPQKVTLRAFVHTREQAQRMAEIFNQLEEMEW